MAKKNRPPVGTSPVGIAPIEAAPVEEVVDTAPPVEAQAGLVELGIDLAAPAGDVTRMFFVPHDPNADKFREEATVEAVSVSPPSRRTNFETGKPAVGITIATGGGVATRKD